MNSRFQYQDINLLYSPSTPELMSLMAQDIPRSDTVDASFDVDSLPELGHSVTYPFDQSTWTPMAYEKTTNPNFSDDLLEQSQTSIQYAHNTPCRQVPFEGSNIRSLSKSQNSSTSRIGQPSMVRKGQVLTDTTLDAGLPLLSSISCESSSSSCSKPLQSRSPRQLSAASVCVVQTTIDPRIFTFRCTLPQCHRRTFSRWYDFNRHYNGAHAAEKTAYWCPVSECTRSEGNGNRTFPRKDKMMDHAWKVHDIQECDLLRTQ